MHMRTAVLPILLASLGAVLLLPSEAAARDTIKVQGDEAPRSVEFLDMSLDQFRFLQFHTGQQRPTEEVVSTSEIVSFSIDYQMSSRPGQFGDIKDALDSSEWAEALQIAGELLTAQENGRPILPEPSRSDPALIRGLVLYHGVQAGYRLGSEMVNVPGLNNTTGTDAAIEYARQFEDLYRRNYYLTEVRELLGMAYEQKGDVPRARAAYERLAQIDAARGAFRLAIILFNQRSYQEAMTRFREAKTAAEQSGDAITADRCELFVGKCQLETGNWNEALGVFNALVGEEGPDTPDVIGGAYLGRGEVLGHNGQFEEAFVALAKAATVFKSDITPTDLRRAVGLMAQAASRLASDDEAWQARAERLRSYYQSRYRARGQLPEFR